MPWIRSLAVLLVFSALAVAADWPQWLGPNRDCSTPEKITPWKSLKVVWKKPVGEAHSSPIIVGGKVYLFTKVKGKEEEQLTAFDAKTGDSVWNKTYPRTAFSSPFGKGPQSTPAFSKDKIYSYGATGLLTCFAASEGNQLWQVDTLKEFKAVNLRFGVACSPLVNGDNVIVNVGGKEGSMVAFNKETGATAWKSGTDPASYSSPIVFGKDKDRQIVFLTQKGLVALKPSDGTPLWNYKLVDLLNESSTTPVRVGADLLYASSVTFGSVALKIDDKSGKPGEKEDWKNGTLTCYFSTPVPVGEDYVYVVTGQLGFGPASSNLHCVEAKTGKILWTKEKVGRYHAALLRTGDNKLLMLDDFGNLSLIEPDPKEFKELARSKVCGQTWAHPALSEGKVYIRDERELMCIQLSE